MKAKCPNCGSVGKYEAGFRRVIASQCCRDVVYLRTLIEDTRQLKRRIRLARTIVVSPAFSERGHYIGELADLLDLRRPPPKGRTK